MKTIPTLLFLFCYFFSTAQENIADTTLAKQLLSQAIEDQQKGAFTTSNEKIQKVLDIYSDNERWEDYLMSKTQMIRNYWRAGIADTALILCQEILDSEHFIAQSLVAAEVYSNMGVIHDKKGMYDKALLYYKKCLAIRKEKLGNEHVETGKVYFNMGASYTYKQETNKALEYFEYTLLNFRQSLPENHPYFIFVYRNISAAYKRQNNFKQSIDHINLGLKVANSIYPQNHFQILQLKKDKIAVYSLEPNSIDKTISLYQEVLPPLTKIYGEAHYQIITDYLNLADLYTVKKNRLKSQYYFQKAEQLITNNYPPKHHLYTLLYEKHIHACQVNNNDSLSLQYCHKAILSLCTNLDDNSPLDYPINYSSVTTSNSTELCEYLMLKVNFLFSLKEKKPQYTALYQQGIKDANVMLARTNKNIDNLNDRIKLLKNARFIVHWKLMSYIKEDPTQHLFSLEELALEADQCKSMLLQTALSSNNALQFGNIPDSLKTKETKLKKSIAELSQQINKASQDQNEPLLGELKKELFQQNESYNNFVSYLEKNFPNYFKLKYETNYPSIETIQKELLDDKTLLINYILYKDYIALVQITSTDITINKTPVKNNFIDTLSTFRKYLKDIQYIRTNPKESYSKFTEQSHGLYLKLLKDYIPLSIENLIIIPDKELGRIPFEVLLTEPVDIQKQDYKTLPYLIKKYNIRYAYSAALLLESQRKVQQKNSSAYKMAGFAASYPIDSTSSKLRQHLIPLPGAYAEVNLLKDKFEGDFYTQTAANEHNFNHLNFSDYSIIHLAMHGIMNKENPMSSLLAFTEDTTESEDDLVYAHELTNMTIPSNLVVLSACETGDGKIESVEGIMSIGRSFIYAGTPSIVMSLWQINDASTARLMQLFYNYLSQGLEKDKALRQAKLDYLSLAEGWAAHPNFWAPFVQLGDNSPILLRKKNDLWNSWKGWSLLGGIVLVGLLGFWIYRSKKSPIG